MNGKQAKKLRKEVKNVYVKTQEVFYEQIKAMSFWQRLKFAFIVVFKRMK